MDVFYPNSITAVVKVKSSTFSGTATEVDRIADEIGQYGKIASYSTQITGNTTTIIFKLDN